MSTAIDIASQALVGIGANAIQSFTEGTTEANVAAQLYDQSRDAMLAAHPWNFATAQHDLNELVTAPLTDYTTAFQLPADLIRVIAANDGAGRKIRDYRIEKQTLLCNSDNVILQFIYRADESLFPPHFIDALVARLKVVFCIPLTESTTRAEYLYNAADTEMRRARNIDSQQDTPQAITDFPLWSVRGSVSVDPDGAA